MTGIKKLLLFLPLFLFFQAHASSTFNNYHTWDKELGPWTVLYEKDGYFVLVPKSNPFVEHDYTPEPILFNTIKIIGHTESVILKVGILKSFCFSQKGTISTAEGYALSNPNRMVPEAELPFDFETKNTEVEATARYLCKKNQGSIH